MHPWFISGPYDKGLHSQSPLTLTQGHGLHFGGSMGYLEMLTIFIRTLKNNLTGTSVFSSLVTMTLKVGVEPVEYGPLTKN